MQPTLCHHAQQHEPHDLRPQSSVMGANVARGHAAWGTEAPWLLGRDCSGLGRTKLISGFTRGREPVKEAVPGLAAAFERRGRAPAVRTPCPDGGKRCSGDVRGGGGGGGGVPRCAKLAVSPSSDLDLRISRRGWCGSIASASCGSAVAEEGLSPQPWLQRAIAEEERLPGQIEVGRRGGGK